ncbi:MAG: hypothetical protein BWK79_04490 [Beggiatoa sp. IS2]|nr:MAG: hypothetical protein BWK79_04490 [Beggiatoa sp. IS2]
MTIREQIANDHSLVKEIDELLRYLEEDDWLMQTLHEIIYSDTETPKQYLEVEMFVKRILNCDSLFFSKHTKLKEVADEVYKNLAAVRKKLKNISAKKLFLKLAQFEGHLRTIIEYAGKNTSTIRKILTDVSCFSSDYETYLEMQTDVTTIRVFKAAVDLESSIKFLRILTLIHVGLKENRFLEESSNTLSFLVPPDIKFEQLVERIVTLESIYSELCQLLNITLSECPVRVVNYVEGGKLRLKVIGNNSIIELMTFLIESDEPLVKKVEALSEISLLRRVENSKKVLHLTSKQENTTADALKNKVDIQKTSASIIEKLNVLVKGQSAMEKADGFYRQTNEVKRGRV